MTGKIYKGREYLCCIPAIPNETANSMYDKLSELGITVKCVFTSDLFNRVQFFEIVEEEEEEERKEVIVPIKREPWLSKVRRSDEETV